MPDGVLSAGHRHVALAAPAALDGLRGVAEQVGRLDARVRSERGDEGRPAGVAAAAEDDRAHAGLLAHGDGEVAEVARREVVDAGHDQAALAAGGQLGRPARRPRSPAASGSRPAAP